MHERPDGADPAGVVYDLDGTLVRLAVDWDAVAADLRALFDDAGVAADDWGVWEYYDRAPAHDLAAAVERTIAGHELTGARRADRLPTADEVLERPVPVGVCSLNAEAACRLALETQGLADRVDAIVGRDTVGAVKPDPEPLLHAVDALGIAPAEALFVGNGRRDEETARRAGVPFAYVGGDGPTR